MKALRSRQSSIACVLLVLYLPACTSTHVAAVPTPAQLVEAARPPSIRLTRADGLSFTLEAPLVRGDSLVGVVGTEDAPRTISIPLSDILSASITLEASVVRGDSLAGAGTLPGASSTMGVPQNGAGGASAEMPFTITWKRGTPTPARLVETEHPQTIRVRRTNGTSLTIQSPTVRGDNLVSAAGTPGVALSDVGSVEVKKTSAGKTILLIVAVPLVAIAVLAESDLGLR